ncbi:DUF2147 domain-containing protein [Limnohabitans radicicola]|uniref:DUF2147 domain-containing protein n=1 Tax=Limnohabitans radicicola TaxID=2771427 RepID=A0A927IKE6_9BURK|nr:DUF2147 domain-containing protein [Limnohabitans radicicola]MBD8049538.1 DUF2147 domain-containing protein [Limnohabitans radicicola]
MSKKAWLALAGCLTFAAHAQMSPLGLWRTIDDETNQPKAEIRISLNASGVLSGVVERSLLSTPSAEPNCNLCTDDRKGKPKIGLEIIRGGQQSDGKTVWEGGKILDPENGKNYSLRLTPIEGGKKLEVRGYIGAPLLGRTQTWIRVQ